MTDKDAQDHGFADLAEFFRMVSSVKLEPPGAISRFKAWQYADGSKEGLQALIDRQAVST